MNPKIKKAINGQHSKQLQAADEDMLEIEVLTFLQNKFGDMDVASVTGNPNKLIEFLNKHNLMATYMPIIEKLTQKQITRSTQQSIRSSAAFIGQHSTPKTTRCDEDEEEEEEEQNEPIDLSIKSSDRRRVEYDVVKRSDYINLNTHQRKRKSVAPMKAVMVYDSDELSSSRSPSPRSLQTPIKPTLPEIGSHPKLMSWQGDSIYENLPHECVGRFNKILLSSFNLKVKVLSRLNEMSPIKYDYNEKKSLVRTSYGDRLTAEERIKNNIASRRSRHRKKFKNIVKHNAVNFDREETQDICAQIETMKRFIRGLEHEVLDGGETSHDMIMDLRGECGLV